MNKTFILLSDEENKKTRLVNIYNKEPDTENKVKLKQYKIKEFLFHLYINIILAAFPFFL
jgi:hypothetical protein